MSNRIKRIILSGKGGSGKNYLFDKFISKGYSFVVGHTTRPPRPGETEGKDYHFTTPGDFESMISNNELYQHDQFNGWFYGTTIEEWNTKELHIMTPRGIAKILPEDRKDCFIIYIDISEDIRKERLSARISADNVDRRLAADTADFADFTDFDLRISNPDF